MKITIINHSDIRGGASVVSKRLLDALIAAGVDAHMLVVHKATDNPAIAIAGNKFSRKIPFFAEEFRILAACRGDKTNIFKVSIATDGLPLSRHPLVRQADVVMLNWINQGMLSLEEIGRIAALGKTIIWTMHDMWNAVGICHHAGDCKNWLRTKGCSFCPMLGKGYGSNDISARTYARKRDLYRSSNITFVSVSRWLADICHRSPLMKGCRTEIIPNALPVERFRTMPHRSRAELDLPEGKIILMGAARIDDPIKGLPLAIEALNTLPADGSVSAVFFGALRDSNALSTLKIPYRHLGTITDSNVLADIYAHADVVLSSSHYETFPGTMVEAQASGAIPVAFDHGGQSDIIENGITGYLATYPSTESLSQCLQLALDGSISSETLRAASMRYVAANIAGKYLDLIKKLQKKLVTIC